MKQNNDYKQTNTIELNDQLAGHIAALKSEQLTENDYLRMESNLQRVIIAQGNREALQSEILQPHKANIFEQLKALLGNAFSWKPAQLAGSMGAIMLVVLTIAIMGTPSKTAFAAVLSEMKLAHSMFYSSRIDANGMHLMDMKVYYRELGQLRVETLSQGGAKNSTMINVMRLNEGKGMLFYPGLKMAVPFNFDVNSYFLSPDEDPLYWYQQLQSHQGEPAEYLDAEMINGVLAEGFTIRENGANITVWADSESHLPLKLIVTLDEVNGQVPFEMVADLLYNQPFDDALFSLEILEGYNISTKGTEHH